MGSLISRQLQRVCVICIDVTTIYVMFIEKMIANSRCKSVLLRKCNLSFCKLHLICLKKMSIILAMTQIRTPHKIILAFAMTQIRTPHSPVQSHTIFQLVNGEQVHNPFENEGEYRSD